jgi:hypothetical protein
MVLSNDVSIDEREVYSFFDSLASTGGFMEIMTITIVFFIGGIQETLFRMTMISKLFVMSPPSSMNES